MSITKLYDNFTLNINYCDNLLVSAVHLIGMIHRRAWALFKDNTQNSDECSEDEELSEEFFIDYSTLL